MDFDFYGHIVVDGFTPNTIISYNKNGVAMPSGKLSAESGYSTSIYTP